MKHIGSLESDPDDKPRHRKFKCGRCKREMDYLEFRGMSLNERDQVFPDRDYQIALYCPFCQGMQPLRIVKFTVSADA